MPNRLTLSILIACGAFFSFMYSVNHYGDGGCDGGLCAFYLFSNGIPLLLAWLFFLLAGNAGLKLSSRYFIYLTVSFFLNLIIVMADYSYYHEELKYPGYFLLFLQTGSLILYLYLKNKQDTEAW